MTRPTTIKFERGADLADALKRLCKTVVKATWNDADLYVRIYPDNGSARLVVASSTTGAAVRLPAECRGRTMLSAMANRLSDLVGNLPGNGREGVTITQDGQMIDVESGPAKATLSQMRCESQWDERRDVRPDENLIAAMEMGTRDLKSALQSTMRGVPVKDPRKVLLGVLFDLNADRLVGTDGKLLFVERPEIGEKRGTGDYIVTREALLALRALLPLGGDRIEFAIARVEDSKTPHVAVFTSGDVELWSVCIEGDYPKVDHVVPKSFAYEVTLDRDEVLAALAFVAAVSDRMQERVVVSLSPGGGCCVHSYSGEDSRGTMAIGGEDWAGDASETVTGFNRRYLQRLLSGMRSGMVTFRWNKPTSPFVLREAGNEDLSTRLIMPIKLTVEGLRWALPPAKAA